MNLVWTLDYTAYTKPNVFMYSFREMKSCHFVYLANVLRVCLIIWKPALTGFTWPWSWSGCQCSRWSGMSSSLAWTVRGMTGVWFSVRCVHVAWDRSRKREAGLWCTCEVTHLPGCLTHLPKPGKPETAQMKCFKRLLTFVIPAATHLDINPDLC